MGERIFESFKYPFKADELRVLGESLARETQIESDIEAEKKMSMAQFNGRLKEAGKRVAELADKINLGYEFREVECLADFDVPRPGMKRIIRTDTNEFVRDEAMTMAEMQSSFGFKEEPPEDGKTKGGGA